MMDTKTLSFEVPRFAFPSKPMQSKDQVRSSPALVARVPTEFACAKTLSFKTSFNFKMALDFQLPSAEWKPQDAKTFSFETNGDWSLKHMFGVSALAAKTLSLEMA